MSEIILRVVAIGVGAALVMDVWGLILKRVYGVAGLDYRLVGRWIGHMTRGRCNQDGIGRMPPIPAEGLIGWSAHYAIGVAFAAGLVGVFGRGWLEAPTIIPALLTGLITLTAPFLVMQPALGLGIAASRTANPNIVRMRSLITHLVFGSGLYIAARLWTALESTLLNLNGKI
jgi:hypothetical protein